MNVPINAPVGASLVRSIFVRYAGTDEIKVGEPFAYAVAHGTATERDARRHNEVVRPSAAASVFAGVAAKAYPADTGDRLIELAAPGSMGVLVRIGESVATGDRLTFGYGAGKRFVKGNTALTAVGIGDAVARQTVAYSASDPATAVVQADLCIAPYKNAVAAS